MKLLDGKLYDPAAAVNKVTTALLALTALDTVNLRLTVVVPKSGKILVRLGGQLHGATTLPAIVLGVLEGSTVRGRRAPMVGGGNLAATGIYSAECEFLITGLVAGNNITLDAAYGVETLVATTGLKYGGPNNATANDNFGGFQFELWDPDPYAVDAAGNVQADVREVNGTAQTAGDIIARLPAALVGGRMDSSVGAMAAGSITAAAHAAGAIDANALAADAANEIRDAIWAAVARTLTANPGLDAAGVRAAIGLAAANLDAQIGALPTAVENRAEMDANSVGLAAIKVKTDGLNFTVPGYADANLVYVNGVQLVGDGSGVPFNV